MCDLNARDVGKEFQVVSVFTLELRLFPANHRKFAMFAESQLQVFRQALLAFTIAETERFIADHPGETFYAFAYDCNLFYGETSLCLNTEEFAAETLRRYQEEYPEHYQNEDDRQDLRYNTGDWQYQCFATGYVMSEDDINAATGYDEDLDGDEFSARAEQALSQLMAAVRQTLAEFVQSDAFRRIPKTADFVAFATDHDDEGVDWAQVIRIKAA